jgi:hypothetical protein
MFHIGTFLINAEDLQVSIMEVHAITYLLYYYVRKSITSQFKTFLFLCFKKCYTKTLFEENLLTEGMWRIVDMYSSRKNYSQHAYCMIYHNTQYVFYNYRVCVWSKRMLDLYEHVLKTFLFC